jgi:hypothetical protein
MMFPSSRIFFAVIREQPREQVEVEPEPVPVPAESAREQIERGIAEAMAKRSDNADAD